MAPCTRPSWKAWFVSELENSVRLLGRVHDHDLVDVYRAADLGLVPTRSLEGFGLVVIEAAACGTPTIVTRVGGLPEAVAGLDPSLIVAPNDGPALAARIVDAARDGGLPRRAATRRFAEDYSWDFVADHHRAVYREAVAAPTGERRIRVVYLDHVAQLSGAEIALLRMLPHLTAIESHVVLAEDGPFADALVQAGISTEVLPMSERARGLRKGTVTPLTVPPDVLAATATYILRLAMYLRRLRPDLVHTNTLKAGVYGSLAARLADVPVVWHVHERIADDYLPQAAVWMVRVMTRSLPAAVIANSKATLRTLKPPAHRASMYTVLPSAVVRPVTTGRREVGPLTVGMIGRFAPLKGQDLFLRAFARAFPSGDTRCVVVGSALFGEDAFGHGLHDLATELGIGSRVEFRGFQADIWRELARIDMLVHASIIPEPFGQVILEGMAAGVPVIAADAGGPAELISHGVNGLLYPLGDLAALAAAMVALGEDPQRRARLVIGGATTVTAHHPDQMARRLEQLYSDVIQRTRMTE